MNKTIYKSIFLAALLFSLAACGSSRRVVYFQDADLVQKVETEAAFRAQIQPDDLLSIIVSCENQEAAEPFNTPMMTVSSNSGNQIPRGYLVDKDGFIDFPVLGKINVNGLSRNDLSELFKDKLSAYLNNPIISIQFLNFKVTVLGEVKTPGTYKVSSERVSILDALAMAGDLQINGKRKNVLILREYGNEKVFARLDLTNSDFLTSPYFYMQQNDVIYVEPSKARIFQTQSGTQVFSHVLSIVSSILSLGSIVLMYVNMDWHK